MAKEYDPRMHSAEHILNQTMVRMFGRGRSFSAHIEKKKSKCDYRFDRDLTPGEAAELEKRINAVIAEDLPVTEELVPRQEAAALFNLERLPEDAGDRIRIIRIGQYDACPCRGQHVRSTGEIPGVSIISTGYKEGVLRIRFRLRDDGQSLRFSGNP
jgi:Ser-tRNA(Ala) deacylase AlaX